MVLRLIAPEGHAVADEVRVAGRFLERARGLISRPEPGKRHALLLPRAKQIHTFGMRYPIDVIFCARDGEVLRVIRHMRPGRITRVVYRSGWVLEMRAGSADEVSPGDRLSLVQSSVSESPR